jgi:hypothetical protein
MKKRFVYNGSAVPFSGRIVRIDPLQQVDHPIDARASSSISVGGGLSTGEGSDFDLKVSAPSDLSLVKAARFGSRSEGFHPEPSGKDRTIRTEVKAWVENVVLLEKIRIDVVRAGLESTHTQKRGESPAVIPTDETTIEGVWLGDTELKIKLGLKRFQQYPTRRALRSALKDDPTLAAELRAPLDSEEARGFSGMPEFRGVMVGTIVRKISTVGKRPKDIHIDGHRVTWDDVGTLYFGELLMADDYRRLTMVRVALGSPIEGRFDCADVQTNGMSAP